jgi:hypothetical protein
MMIHSARLALTVLAVLLIGTLVGQEPRGAILAACWIPQGL